MYSFTIRRKRHLIFISAVSVSKMQRKNGFLIVYFSLGITYKDKGYQLQPFI